MRHLNAPLECATVEGHCRGNAEGTVRGGGGLCRLGCSRDAVFRHQSTLTCAHRGRWTGVHPPCVSLQCRALLALAPSVRPPDLARRLAEGAEQRGNDAAAFIERFLEGSDIQGEPNHAVEKEVREAK